MDGDYKLREWLECIDWPGGLHGRQRVKIKTGGGEQRGLAERETERQQLGWSQDSMVWTARQHRNMKYITGKLGDLSQVALLPSG